MINQELISRLAQETRMMQYVAPDNKFLERFAEQLLAEVIEVIDNQLQTEETEAGLVLAKRQVKKHFFGR